MLFPRESFCANGINHQSYQKEKKQETRLLQWRAKLYLVQEVVVADLLPEVEHRHDVAYGEHVSAGVPEKRALLPHGHNNTSYIRGQPGE